MLPKYSKYEIQSMIRQKLEGAENDQKSDLVNGTTAELLGANTFWTSEDYQKAAEIIGMSQEELVSMIPDEPLERVSFRAEKTQ